MGKMTNTFVRYFFYVVEEHSLLKSVEQKQSNLSKMG